LGNFTEQENKILIALVADTVNYSLSEKESLVYIKTRFGKEISSNAYYSRKRKIDSGSYAQTWLNYFSRIGFVVNHKRIIDTVEMVQTDTIKDYLIMQNSKNKDPEELRKIRYDIRENAKLLQELSLGTPIIAQIKNKINQAQILQSGE
jgi:hypothetical protein